ncbi:MAG: hypothetical protein E7262_03095 [Lachnospiraceae bacterium]|nr:hypothetical protein [Lachnospiraceae bacterium]
MFTECKKLKSIDVSKFNTKNVTNMGVYVQRVFFNSNDRCKFI